MSMLIISNAAKSSMERFVGQSGVTTGQFLGRTCTSGGKGLGFVHQTLAYLPKQVTGHPFIALAIMGSAVAMALIFLRVFSNTTPASSEPLLPVVHPIPVQVGEEAARLQRLLTASTAATETLQRDLDALRAIETDLQGRLRIANIRIEELNTVAGLVDVEIRDLKTRNAQLLEQVQTLEAGASKQKELAVAYATLQEELNAVKADGLRVQGELEALPKGGDEPAKGDATPPKKKKSIKERFGFGGGHKAKGSTVGLFPETHLNPTERVKGDAQPTASGPTSDVEGESDGEASTPQTVRKHPPLKDGEEALIHVVPVVVKEEEPPADLLQSFHHADA